VRVGQDLHLDVARVRDLSLQIEGWRSERRGRLAGRAAPGGVEVLIAGDDAHPLAAATAGRLEEHRIADLLRCRASGGGITQRLRAFGDRNVGRASEAPGRRLLSEEALHLRGRADEGEPGVGNRLRKVGVLGEESVARVDRVAPRAFRDFDDPRGIEVALTRRRWTDRIRGVGGADMQRVAVDIAEDGGRADAEVVAGADDAERDLAAIGDEDGGERRSPS
jgi:hypothetical protein